MKLSSTVAAVGTSRDEYIVRRSSTTATNEDAWGPASTGTQAWTLQGARIVAPLFAIAAFAAPQLPIGFRRRYSGSERSSSEIVDLQWALDEWQYTEEWATADQVAALNALLALPAREGFSLDLPD